MNIAHAPASLHQPLLDQRTLGLMIVLLLLLLVVVKRVATGSLLDKPRGGLMMRLVNVFNLFFLLVVNPLAALALITRCLEALDPTRVAIAGSGPLMAAEIAGLLLIPKEEDGMRKVYGESYAVYRMDTRKLIPFVY